MSDINIVMSNGNSNELTEKLKEFAKKVANDEDDWSID